MSTNPILENIRRALGRPGNTLSGARPEVYPPRQAGSTEEEIDRFILEVNKLKGEAERVRTANLAGKLSTLVSEYDVKKATVWKTPRLERLGAARTLEELGVELVSPNADKLEMAQCDLGITEAEYLLPETGSLVLRSSAEKPRAVSLLPRIHLAMARVDMLRADMHQVFAEAKDSNYLVFITGPSRTADIELTVTLGVHGPRNLIVWIIDD